MPVYYRCHHYSDRMFPTTVLFFVFLLAVCYLIYRLYRYNTYLDYVPKPPSKWGWIVGHTATLFNSTDVLKVATEAVIKYGGLIRVLIPPSLTVVITDNEIIQQFFKDSVDKAGDYAFLQPWLGTGLVTSNGLPPYTPAPEPEGVFDPSLNQQLSALAYRKTSIGPKWKRRRKLLSQCFGSLTLMKDFIRVFDESGDDFIKELENKIDDKNLDLIPVMKNYTMHILFETSMGVPLSSRGDLGDIYIKSIQDICRVMANRFKTPYKRVYALFQLTKDYAVLQSAIKVVNSFFDDIFQEKLEKLDGEIECDDKKAFLDVLLQFYKSGDLTKDDIRDEVNTFMFGGYDTTAIGLSFALYALAHHPEIQEKVVEEQIEIFGSLHSGIEVTYGHLQQMRYLEYVVLETMRLYPPVPFIGKKVMKTIETGEGIVLPEGLSVGIFIYACHHHPKYFREPEKFIPERFETDEILPYTFFPFGTGQRTCIGKKYAMLEMKTTISKIVSHFRLLPSQPDCKPQLLPEITLATIDGVRISLEKR